MPPTNFQCKHYIYVRSINFLLLCMKCKWNATKFWTGFLRILSPSPDETICIIVTNNAYFQSCADSQASLGAFQSHFRQRPSRSVAPRTLATCLVDVCHHWCGFKGCARRPPKRPRRNFPAEWQKRQNCYLFMAVASPSDSSWGWWTLRHQRRCVNFWICDPIQKPLWFPVTQKKGRGKKPKNVCLYSFLFCSVLQCPVVE